MADVSSRYINVKAEKSYQNARLFDAALNVDEKVKGGRRRRLSRGAFAAFGHGFRRTRFNVRQIDAVTVA